MGRFFTIVLLVLLALVVVLPYLAFVHHVHYPPRDKVDAFVTSAVDIAATDLFRVIHDAQIAVALSQRNEVAPDVELSVNLNLNLNQEVGTHQQTFSLPPMKPVPLSPLADQRKLPEVVALGEQSPANSRNEISRGSPFAEVKNITRERRKLDVVVGLGTGITPENLAVFAGSLRAVNPLAAIVLYLDSPLPKLHSAIVSRYNVTSIEFSVNLLQPAFLQKYHPSNYRWPLLYRYLANNKDLYAKVVMADVRDTCFQKDPFASFGRGFFTFNGVESRTIGECGWNGGWVKDCFGQKMLNRLSKNTIICSGISMGTTAEVVAYLKAMSETMETEAFAKCERNGVDQGVHNVLVHTGRIQGVQVLDQGSGWVANLQAGRAKIAKHVVLNQKGGEVSVVHQYDRYKDLQASYFQKFVFWELPSEEETCELFTVAKNKELFKKRCDLKVSSGHSTSHCCESCLRVKDCKAFSFAGSQCFLKSCAESVSSIAMKGVNSGFLTSMTRP